MASGDALDTEGTVSDDRLRSARLADLSQSAGIPDPMGLTLPVTIKARHLL
jgi:hypothetical protein